MRWALEARTPAGGSWLLGRQSWRTGFWDNFKHVMPPGPVTFATRRQARKARIGSLYPEAQPVKVEARVEVKRVP